MKILRPEKLKPGDTIGIVAPSGHFKSEPFKSGIAVIKSLGLKVKYPHELFFQKRYLAGSDTQRAAMVNRTFADPSVQGLFCARGGFGAMRILKYLDYENIRNHPKFLMGFSDITAMLITVFQKTGLVCIHGPNVTTLSEADTPSLDHLGAVLFNKSPLEVELKSSLVLKNGVGTGRLIGGNLTTICHLMGTPFSPDFNNTLLFLEDVGESPYRIDRMLSQMKLCGCLERLRGVLLGRFTQCGDRDMIFEIVNDIFKEMDIPIISGFQVGHKSPNLAIPVGVKAVLDTRIPSLKIF